MSKERVWLKNIRESKRLTQENIAANLGVTRQHIGLIENGIANPSPELAKKIAIVLDFDWTLFYQEKIDQNSA